MKKWASFGDIKHTKSSSIKRKTKKLNEKPKSKKERSKREKRKDKEKGGSKRKKGGSKREKSPRKKVQEARAQPNKAIHRKTLTRICQIEALPENILGIILGCLDPSSLLILSSVSTNFYRACENDSLWEHLYQSHETKVATEREHLLKKANFTLIENNTEEANKPLASNNGDAHNDETEEDKESSEDENAEVRLPGSWKTRFKEMAINAKREQIILRGLIYETNKERRKSMRSKGKSEGSRAGGKKQQEEEEEDNTQWACRLQFKTAQVKEQPPQFALRGRKAEMGADNESQSPRLARLLLYALNNGASQPTKVPFLITKAFGKSVAVQLYLFIRKKLN